MSAQRTRTVVLISGRGSNMTALIAAASDPAFPAEIVGVISDKADAAGLRAVLWAPRPESRPTVRFLCALIGRSSPDR